MAEALEIWPENARVGMSGSESGLVPAVFADSSLASSFPFWLIDPLRNIHHRLLQNKLPHAMLVHAPPGSGKRFFVEALVARLMCDASKDMDFDSTSGLPPLACGNCASCSQLRTGNQIDFKVISPEDGSRNIKVDQVRDFTDWLSRTSRRADAYRVGVVDCADDMNRSSANALLKTLEEPAAASKIILIGSWPRSLPATITSRCMLVPVSAVPVASAVDWLVANGVDNAKSCLRQAHGAPFDAMHAATDDKRQQSANLIRCFSEIVSRKAGIAVWVERLKDESPRDCLEAFADFTADVCRVNQGCEKECMFPEEVERWQLLSGQLNNVQWFALHNELLQLLKVDSASFKVQPVLETVFAVIWRAGVRTAEGRAQDIT